MRVRLCGGGGILVYIIEVVNIISSSSLYLVHLVEFLYNKYSINNSLLG